MPPRKGPKDKWAPPPANPPSAAVPAPLKRLPTATFHDLFVFPMQRVLLEEITDQLQRLTPIPLTVESINALKAYEATPREREIRKGLYILHYKGEVCYAGKADVSLSSRLTEHFVKLSARMGITPAQVDFRCLYLDENWSATAHEQALIAHFQSKGVCAWNNGGFGNNDPGRQRDKTELRADHFDRMFPIDPNLPIELLEKKGSILRLLEGVKASVPYNFRFELRKKNAAAEAEIAKEYSSVVDLTDVRPATAKSLLHAIVDALGPQWQVTFLYGYVILYKEGFDYSAECQQMFKVGGKVENVI